MDEIKVGARHSAGDKKDMQTLHDIAVRQGAMCATQGKSMNDELVYFGDSVKATQLENGGIKLGGYLVRFGSPEQTDLTGDYFTKSTGFGDATISDAYFNHRLPVKLKKHPIQVKYT